VDFPSARILILRRLGKGIGEVVKNTVFATEYWRALRRPSKVESKTKET
jgi:hypothetical protein